MRARLGPQQAIVATAHKIARVVYHLLKTGEPSQQESAEVDEQKRQARELKNLTRRAQKLGYTLTRAAGAAEEPSEPEVYPGAGGSDSVRFAART